MQSILFLLEFMQFCNHLVANEYWWKSVTVICLHWGNDHWGIPYWWKRSLGDQPTKLGKNRGSSQLFIALGGWNETMVTIFRWFRFAKARCADQINKQTSARGAGGYSPIPPNLFFAKKNFCQTKFQSWVLKNARRAHAANRTGGMEVCRTEKEVSIIQLSQTSPPP